LAPAAALALLVFTSFVEVVPSLAAVSALALFGAVLVAVHHAEVVALRVGEPFGTLILALSVTVIEASLILSMMLAGGEEMASLPRDTIYAAVMIICNGVIGLCLLLGGIKHREQFFRVEGAGAGLAALIVMSSLVMAFPTFTTSAPVASYNTRQLVFVAITSAALWIIYVFIQTVRHRDYFLSAGDATPHAEHAAPPSKRDAWISFALLLVSLITVVGLAKVLSPSIEAAVDAVDAPRAVVGIVIALLVLLPETVAAARAARVNQLQVSMNLAVGSALASIGLTIPVVVVAAIWFDLPLVLGLGATEMLMLAVTLLVSTLTLGTGRSHVMQGAVHLVLFAAFLFLAIFP
jgi:Ca2+:H+ antiporter